MTNATVLVACQKSFYNLKTGNYFTIVCFSIMMEKLIFLHICAMLYLQTSLCIFLNNNNLTIFTEIDVRMSASFNVLTKNVYCKKGELFK